MSQSSSPHSNQRTDINDASVEGQVSQAGRDNIQNQGQGNIYKDVTINNYSYPKADASVSLSRQEYLNRQSLLHKVRNSWINGVLEQSLYKKAKIELGLEQWFDVLDLTWVMPEQPRQPLPSGTKAIDKFDELGTGARTLLILGAPGAGKTTTLLELACDLLNRAEQDVNQSIPVVFNLSSWTTSRQKIADWLVQELNTKYQVSKTLGQTWIQNQQLLLLLDGLDEVHQIQRNACVMAINEFSQDYGQTDIVVCSRIKDYEALSHRLHFQGAIFIQPLTPEQSDRYLQQAGKELAGVRAALQICPTLREVVQTPLILSIMTLAYQGMSLTELPRLSFKEQRKHLFDTYIQRMLERRSSDRRYSKEQTVRYLSWLAQKMLRESQTIFLIERLQIFPLFTSPFKTVHQKWLYIILITFMAGLVNGLIFGLGSGLTYGLSRGFMIGAIALATTSVTQVLGVQLFFVAQQQSPAGSQTPQKRVLYSLCSGLFLGPSFGFLALAGMPSNLQVGLIIGLLGGLVTGSLDWFLNGIIVMNMTNPVESLHWSWKSARNNLIFWFSVALPFGLLLSFLGILGKSLTVGLISGLFVALFAGLLGGLKSGSGIGTKTIPNQGIWLAAKTSFSVAIVATLLLFLMSQATHVPLFFPVSEGLLMGLYLGGAACMVHFTLRIVFFLSKCMPWNYARFLDWAVDRLFLQKVGGGYIFIHRLLMEHFAAIDIQ